MIVDHLNERKGVLFMERDQVHELVADAVNSFGEDPVDRLNETMSLRGYGIDEDYISAVLMHIEVVLYDEYRISVNIPDPAVNLDMTISQVTDVVMGYIPTS